IDAQELTFDGKLPTAVDQKIPGSFLFRGQLVLTALEPSRLTAFDRFELFKEIVAQAELGPTLFDAIAELLLMAGSKRAKPDEVRAWAEKADQAAEAYGIRWQQAVALRQAQALAAQKDYAAIALTQAQRAERLLDPTELPDTRLIVLETLARLL